MVPTQLFVVLGAAAAVIGSVALSRRTRIPEPCFLILAGLAVSFAPGFDAIRLPPHVVFYGFLPPLLYAAAYLTAPREILENRLSILLLAFGLTAVTLFAVGAAAWAGVAALGAGGAFLLGAILGPTDPISATSVIGATSAPDKLRTILEAESLINDGIGLVAFSIALAAAESGTFSVWHGLARFFELLLGGPAVGLVVAIVIERIRRYVHDAQIEILLSILTPYVAYLPAERAHVSGILATVTCGLYLGWRSEGPSRAEVRVQSIVFWEILTFTLGSILFVLIGTQFRPTLDGLAGFSWSTLTLDALLVFGVVLAVRVAWMFTVPHLVAVLGPSRRWAEIDPWQDRLVLGWSGMRGALSLAAALSVPATVAHHDEILFLTFTTILAGLIVLGVPLPWLLARLGFGPSDVSRSEVETNQALAEAALRRLEALEGEAWLPDEVAQAMRQRYESRIGRLVRGLSGRAVDDYHRLRLELLAAERAELRRREQEGQIGFSAARQIERRLDHEESGLHP